MKVLTLPRLGATRVIPAHSWAVLPAHVLDGCRP